MRKQVPLKASLRQPIRTLIFVLLVGLASFAFVSRFTEYVILNQEINRIEEFYRTVGTLVPIDPHSYNNVYNAANLIADSPYIAFEDRRVVVQGVMHGILNTMRGQHTIGGDSTARGENPFDYKGLNPFDSIAVIEILNITRPIVYITGSNEPLDIIRVSLRVIEVLHGHRQFLARPYVATFTIDENGSTIVDNLEIGENYLVRAIRQRPTDVNPPDFGDGNNIDFFPMFDDVYFVNMADEVAVDLALYNMADFIKILNENSHMLMITGTRDMTILPFVGSGVIQRFQGRFITEEDYLNANPVIVIPQGLDSRRLNARVGETITITLRDMRTFEDGATITPELRQHIEHGHDLISRLLAGSSGFLSAEVFWWALPYGIESHWKNFSAGYWAGIPSNYEGDWQSYDTITINLEVIGTYVYSGNWFTLPRWQHITHSYRELEAFIPASIIPEGWGIVDSHVVSGMYSFLLASPEYITPFISAYADRLEYLGFNVEFIGEDPTNFLTSAIPIRNAIFINLLLSVAVMVIVFTFTVFLYLRQRYKEFAILRALGTSKVIAVFQVMLPVFVFWLPMVIISSVGAWFFAFEQVATSLEVLAELELPPDYGEAFVIRNILEQMAFDTAMMEQRLMPELSLVYLVFLCIALLVIWTVAVLVGALLFSKGSMISLIQNMQNAGMSVYSSNLNEIEANNQSTPVNVNIGKLDDVLTFTKTPKSNKNSFLFNFRNHLRFIKRTPTKTVLVIVMALMFILALGWLNNTINFIESEINRLYDTTIITGEIVSPNTNLDTPVWGHNIPQTSLDILVDSGFIDNYYTTAVSRIGLFAPVNYNGNNLQTIPRFELNMLSIIKTVSDFNVFVEQATRPVGFGLELSGEFELELLFDTIDTFEYVPGEPIPIIVHESLLTRYFMLDAYGITIHYKVDNFGNIITNNLQLGDYVYLLSGHDVHVAMGGWAVDDSYTARIVGVYSGGNSSVTYRMQRGLIIVPEDTRWANHSTITFTVNQENVRNLADFEQALNEQLTYNIYTMVPIPGGYMQLHQGRANHVVMLNDSELMLVVMPLEESLSLLRILEPVARVTSFVIGFGLSLLLILQNAKNAAIFRILGMSRVKVRFNLCVEYLAICFFGILFGFTFVIIMGVGLTTASILSVIYLSGTFSGAVLGVIAISQKPPIQLLQVRE